MPRSARISAFATVLLLWAGAAQSASMSWYLDQSNKLADGINYLMVTIADGAGGDIDFTITALDPLTDGARRRFGIDRFTFNIVGGTATEAFDITGLPDGWRARNGARNAGQASTFGRFDIVLQGRPRARTDVLEFSIAGVTMDDVLSYVDLSTGRAPSGHSFFAARVGGFRLPREAGGFAQTAWFGGTQAVPAPAAVWLLATGIAGLAWRRRARRTT